VAIVNIPRSFQYWANISATPADFNLDAGWYGLTLHATWGGGNATLQKLLPDGTTYVAVATPVAADGYAMLILPAGQYRLAITTATGLTGEIALIARGTR
jgi:hypothetical protein